MTQATMVSVRPFYGGDWQDCSAEDIVLDKFSDEPVTRVGIASRDEVTAAIGSVVAGQAATRWDPPARYRALSAASSRLAADADAFVDAIVTDTGFTLGDARREVSRAADTLLLSGEEAKRLTGEIAPLVGAEAGHGRLGFTVYHPLGVVCAITPFNSPLNTRVSEFHGEVARCQRDWGWRG